jgi:hypothetical protein
MNFILAIFDLMGREWVWLKSFWLKSILFYFILFYLKMILSTDSTALLFDSSLFASQLDTTHQWGLCFRICYYPNDKICFIYCCLLWITCSCTCLIFQWINLNRRCLIHECGQRSETEERRFVLLRPRTSSILHSRANGWWGGEFWTTDLGLGIAEDSGGRAQRL